MADAPSTAQRPPVIAVALVSASALAYEMLLMRLFSIVQWHHFAYMVISLALLGYGISGTVLSLAQRWLSSHFKSAFCLNIALFSLSSVICFLLAQQVTFNPETIMWDWHEPLRLLLMYILLATPFFFAANAVALVFICISGGIASTYAADLLGAGLGSLCVIALLSLTQPMMALGIISAMGMAALLMAIWELPLKSRQLWSVVAISLAVVMVMIAQLARLELSPYKELSQLLRIPGTSMVTESSGALGWLSVVESNQLPLRHAPGLSLMAQDEPPAQVAVLTDGGALTVINDGHAPESAYRYLDQLTWSLPYHLVKARKVLVLGAGGGTEVLQARRYEVSHIDAVELNPQMIDLVRKQYGEFSAHLYDQAGVNVYTAEARGFVATHPDRYDIIQLPLLDSFAASAAGLYALNESYLYTEEAINTYLARLKPGGYLAISRWINLPPRDTLKLFATVVAALERLGVADPGNRIILIRGWQTSTLLVKQGEVTAEEVAVVRKFSSDRAFDVCWFPGIRAEETNRYNRLDEARYYQAARAILGPERDKFLAEYKFNLTPASDDSPYFFQFFRWGSLKEILDLRDSGGMPLLEWGYLVLVATLVQAVLVSAVLILLPLLMFRQESQRETGLSKRIVMIYFGAIGLAFLFIEMAFIQRFLLFLHHPLYATTVVISAFLVCAGLGSACARRLALKGLHQRGVLYAVAGIMLISIIYLYVLDPLFLELMTAPVWTRIVTTIFLIMPLAFCMGFPFPLALHQVGQRAPELIPWAWGVNGCASVISAVLASLLAIHFGFMMVIIAALLLYVVAALVLHEKQMSGFWRRRASHG